MSRLRWLPAGAACILAAAAIVRGPEAAVRIASAADAPTPAPGSATIARVPELPDALAVLLDPAERARPPQAPSPAGVQLVAVEPEHLPLMLAGVAKAGDTAIATFLNKVTGAYLTVAVGEPVPGMPYRLADIGAEPDGASGVPAACAWLTDTQGRRLVVGRAPPATGRLVAVLRVDGRELRAAEGDAFPAPATGANLAVTRIQANPPRVRLTGADGSSWELGSER